MNHIIEISEITGDSFYVGVFFRKLRRSFLGTLMLVQPIQHHFFQIRLWNIAKFNSRIYSCKCACWNFKCITLISWEFKFFAFSGFMKKSWWLKIPMMFGLRNPIVLNPGFPNWSISPMDTMDTLRAGCDRNRRDAMGQCPLFEAARLRCGAVVEIMCQVWGLRQMLNSWCCWCKTSCTSDHQWRLVV